MLRLRIILGALALVAAFGCGKAEKETLQIGAILSTTGALADIGHEQLDAVQLAVSEINAKGGVQGKDLELVHKDDQTTATGGAEAATALIAAGVPVVIGATGSAISLAVHEKLAAAELPQVSASSTSPTLTTADEKGVFFRTCASDALQGRLLARRAKEKGYTKVAVMHLPGAYGKGLADVFKESFIAGAGEISHSLEFEEEKASYAQELTDALAGDPQAILLVAYPEDGAQIIKDYLAAHSARGIFWFFTDGVGEPSFITAVGASNFTFSHEGTGPATPAGAGWDAFSTAFEARTGKKPSGGSFSVNAYDALYLVALALEAGEATPAAVKANLPLVSSGGTARGPADWTEAVADLAAGKDVDYRGVSGPIDFDDNGDVVAAYDIWKVETGAFKVIEASASP